MSQHHPAPDETVRMRADGADNRPPLEPARPSSAEDDAPQGPDAADGVEIDDTRPVPRDWLSGAPEAEAAPADPSPAPRDAAQASTAPPPVAQPDDAEWETQQLGSAADIAAAHPGDDDGGDDGGHGALPPAGGRGRSWWRRRAVLIPAGGVALLAAVYGVDLLVASGEVPRSTVVAGLDIGGLSPAAARGVLEEDLAPRVAADRPFVAEDVEGTFSPVTAGIGLDVAATVRDADDQPLNPWTRLTSLFSDREVAAVLETDDTALDAQLDAVAASVDRAPSDATIAIEGTTPRVLEPADGRTLDREAAAETILDTLAGEADPADPLELPVDVEPVSVDTAEAERVLAETVVPALAAPVEVNGAEGGRSAEVPVSALAASLTFTPTEDGELEVGIDPAALQTALGDELAVFGTPARDASFEVAGGGVRVVPSVDGTGVDPVRLAEQLMGVLTDPAPRSVTAELGPVPAEFTTQEAEALGIREEISSFTTNIGNAASGENIRVVAAEVDGAVVLPGETFSLNTYTGPRGTAQGYVEATVIQGGELAKAVGGGISQFATTMFNAVFFAGLEDVFHKPHSFYISRYPAGREATVYEGAIDLQWRNDSDTGVYIDTRWTPGSITVTFYGTKRYDIESISSERRNPREPAVLTKVDDGNCIPQPGVPGFDITVTRVFKDPGTGAEIKRETFQTRYAAEAVITCVPPDGPPPPPGPEGTAPAGPPAPGGRRPGGRRGR
ncbi:VanW family protein [Candidatus Blastococcus massiliensis]|uniref:VanW family protein n=1 Tax=Candidatus Blastococcus massiliensis TaxID=1470358 RepID=UPI0004AF4D83|nr:VanW family protein [Candidatus Blastococcus massiliensis]